MGIFNDRLTTLENRDVIIRPPLFWSYSLTGGGVMIAIFLLFAFINNAPFNIPMGFMLFMVVGFFCLGWNSRYRSFIKLEKNSLIVSGQRLKPVIISKADVIGISPIEKGCACSIMVSDGRKIDLDTYDARLVAREIKKWEKRKS